MCWSFRGLFHLGVALAILSAFVQRACAQSLPPTCGWQRTFNLPSSACAVEQGPITDASGNYYFSYLLEELNGAYDWHLVKISPANNVVFDKIVEVTDAYDTEIHCNAITPPLNGHQVLYIIGDIEYPDQPTGYIAKFDLNGNPQWTGVHRMVDGVSGRGGVHADAYERIFFAEGGHGDNNGLLWLLELDGNANVVTQYFDNAFVPGWGSGAYVFTSNNKWVIGGFDPSEGAYTHNNAVWGQYDPITGHRDYVEFMQGQGDCNSYPWVQNEIAVSLMRSGEAVVALKTLTQLNLNKVVSSWAAKVVGADGSPAFVYPPSGEVANTLVQLDSFNASSSIYLVGHNPPTNPSYDNGDYLLVFNRDGSQRLSLQHQPTNQIYATAEGFYSSFAGPNATMFLEHFNAASGSYDWGKSYVKGQDPIILMLPAAIYVWRTFSSGSPALDRYALGVSIQSITCPSSAHGGQTITAQIALNAPAPPGGLTVAVNSGRPNLLLPNGTQGQNFVIPAGQSSLTVNMSALPVLAYTPVTVLAIQNGVRRTATTTVRP